MDGIVKIKEVTGMEKSGAQNEADVIEKYTKLNDETPVDPPADPPAPVDPPAPKDYPIEEEKIYSFLSSKLNKEIKSLDDLKEELPDDVSAFYKYKKETNRGIDDFVKLNRDIDKLSDEEKLFEYYSAKEDALEKEDIQAMIKEFEVDEELDLDADINRKKREKKKALNEAKKFFEKQRELYKLPLVSSPADVPQEEKEAFEAYKKYVKEAKTEVETNSKRAEWFDRKTDEVFSDKFKGFEFKVKVGDEEKALTFSPGTPEELKNLQRNPTNLVNRFMDENGLLKDAEGWHRSLAVAMNPEKFAQFFIEQGIAMAKENDDRRMKNINMTVRQTPQPLTKAGFKAREVDQGFSKSLKIKSVKKIQ